MKNLEYYMSLPYRMEIVPDIEEGGYMASFPELPGCLTCADTMEELIVNAQDAKKAWLEASLADGDIIPEPIVGEDIREYSGQFKIRMPKSLHRSLSLRAKAEGISMNQYCIYLLSKGDSANISRPT
jgi:predicted RNase H-like HicB family nuclease